MSGKEAKGFFSVIADMRISLFKEFPYLYEGNHAYEKEYLDIYFRSEKSRILLAFDQDTVIGFSSCIPLNEEFPIIQAPFKSAQLPVEDFLYIGECMLYPEYRSQGIMQKFITFHHTYGMQNGYKKAVFMTVDRPSTHPEKPSSYQCLESFWHHLGCKMMPTLKAHIAWTQSDTQQEELNTLSFWEKTLE